jgi:hypothetical protein
MPTIRENEMGEHNPNLNESTGLLSGATVGRCSLLVHLLCKSDTQDYADRNRAREKQYERYITVM